SARPGLPVSESTSTARGRVQVFRGGHMYWSPDPQIGTHFVYGGILHRYRSIGGSASSLGLPTSDEYSVKGGRASNFEGGRIIWSSAHGAVVVTGGMLSPYLRLGGPAARPGLPVSASAATVGGRVQVFSGGRMYWSPDPRVGTHFTYGAILHRYRQLGGPASFLGLPVSDEHTVPGGRSSAFVGGQVYWSSTTGA